MQRNKGKVFEREIAKRFRDAYPFLDGVRRSQQGGGAEQSDVTGVPGLWIECQDARKPTPRAKLEQAIRDYRATVNTMARCPIAVTHKTGTRTIEVTLQGTTLCALLGVMSSRAEGVVVAMSLDDFLRVAEPYVRRVAGVT